MVEGLSAEQLSSFERDGYLIIPNFFSAEVAAALRTRSDELLDSFDFSTHPKTKFSTGIKSDKHVGDDYYLTSGDKIRFFLEENSLNENGTLRVEKSRAVNKIGHGIHLRDPLFFEFSTKPELQAIVRSLGCFKDPRMLQSLVIFKQPRIGGAVPPHQDTAFLYTEPHSSIGFWFALEDCTEENGCLSFIPGSHRDPAYPIHKRFVRKADNSGTEFVKLDASPGKWRKDPSPEEWKKALVKTGSLVLIHGAYSWSSVT